jgi:hypothetical protein
MRERIQAVAGNSLLEERSPRLCARGSSSGYAAFFSRAQLLPPQHPALLADFTFAQQSPSHSPDLEQQAGFAAAWSFASGCALAASLFISLQHAQSLQAAFSLLHESPLQQDFLSEQHLPFLPLQHACTVGVFISAK